jgi:succinate dehydrogenase flavin-adding protein (antitoxin of CptAB toxin-antitoxin module)
MSDLGISESSLDASEEVSATEGTDTEVNAEEAEASTETVEKEKEGEDKEAPAEDKATEEEENKEAPKEEPQLTLKEFQELEAKRQEVEAKEKALNERVAAQEKEFQEKYLSKVNDFDEMDAFLAHLADKDPDLFGLIQGEFKEHQRQYAGNQKLMNELKSLRDEVTAYKAKASDEVVLTKLDS